MEYFAVEAGTINDLNEKVNALIRRGWIPLGGVSVALSESDDFQYFIASQAMTKAGGDTELYDIDL